MALQEVTPAWATALESLSATYPYRKLLPRDDPYGIALLSKWPLRAVGTADFADDGLPSLVATVEIDGRPLQVIALHTHWPVVPRLQASRDLVLQRAAAVARRMPGATILLGDLNLTPYAPAFGKLLAGVGPARCLWRPQLATDLAGRPMAARLADRPCAGAARQLRRDSRDRTGHRLRSPAGAGRVAPALSLPQSSA